jgi:hypothetical protein
MLHSNRTVVFLLVIATTLGGLHASPGKGGASSGRLVSQLAVLGQPLSSQFVMPVPERVMTPSSTRLSTSCVPRPLRRYLLVGVERPGARLSAGYEPSSGRGS